MYQCCQNNLNLKFTGIMDNQVKKFLKGEKENSTDKSHKCVAKKFKRWLLKCRVDEDPEKRLTLSDDQEKAAVD